MPAVTAAIVAAIVVALVVNRAASVALRPLRRGANPPSARWRTWCRSVALRAGTFTAARRQRRTPVRADVYAGFLDDMARRCATGETLTAAFDGAANACVDPLLAPRLGVASIAVRGGSSLADSVSRHVARDADSAVVGHVIGLCATHGGDVSQSLDRAAATLRERSAAAAERRVQAAQARLSAAVLTVLPLAFATWALATSETVRRFELTPVGAAFAASGLLLNLTGWRLMRRIIGARP